MRTAQIAIELSLERGADVEGWRLSAAAADMSRGSSVYAAAFSACAGAGAVLCRCTPSWFTGTGPSGAGCLPTTQSHCLGAAQWTLQVGVIQGAQQWPGTQHSLALHLQASMQTTDRAFVTSSVSQCTCASLDVVYSTTCSSCVCTAIML
jgi:hypothetical protein